MKDPKVYRNIDIFHNRDYFSKYSLQVPVFLLATMLLLEEVWHPLFDSEHPLLSQLRLDLFC